MIILDTHSWIWWVQDVGKLTEAQQQAILDNEADVIGVSAISCWEIAKLVQRGRLALPLELAEWMNTALSYPGLRLIDLRPEIAIESTRLPGDFHNDPADQIIVATARVWNCPLVTSDSKILQYAHVRTIS